jgi:hypothetical protein
MLKREFYIDVFYISAHRAYTRAKIPSMVSRAALTRARANMTSHTFFQKYITSRAFFFVFSDVYACVPFPPISSFPSHQRFRGTEVGFESRGSSHAAPSPPPPQIPAPLYPPTVRRIHQSSCPHPVPPLPNPRWGARVLPLGGARIVQGVRVWALVPLGAAGAAPFRTGPVQVPSLGGPHP